MNQNYLPLSGGKYSICPACRYLLLFKFLLFFLVSGAQPYALNTSKAKWVPPASEHKFSPRADYTSDQQKKMYDHLSRLLEIVHQTPFLNPPNGYEVDCITSICAIDCSQKRAIKGRAELIIREYYKDMKTGKEGRAGEGPGLNLYVNDIDQIFSNIPPDSNTFYNEPHISSIDDNTVYNQRFLVLTKSSRPLFTYLTSEQLLKHTLKDDEESLAKFRETASQGSGYQQWLATKDENMKGAMAGFDMLAKTDPAKAKTAREEYIKGMKRTDSALKADEGRNLKELQQAISRFEDRVAKTKQKLQSMTAAERSAPAVSAYGEKWVVVNREFYNPALPPSAVQVIVIDLYNYDLKHEVVLSNLEKEMIKKLRETIDLKSLAAACD